MFSLASSRIFSKFEKITSKTINTHLLKFLNFLEASIFFE